MASFPQITSDSPLLAIANTNKRDTARALLPYFGNDVESIRPKFQDIFIGPAPSVHPLDIIMSNVARRRAELSEQGRLGYQRPVDPRGVSKYMTEHLPFEQNEQLRGAVEPGDVEELTVREVPGIGRAVKYGNSATAISGRYGTGVATQERRPDPNRTIEGVPAAQWFANAAKRQETGNKYADASGRVYKTPLHSDDVQHEERLNANRRLDEALARRARYRQNAPGSVS